MSLEFFIDLMLPAWGRSSH